MAKIVHLDAPRPGAGRRERQRIETRGRLYQAALDEFRKTGFQAAQIDRIAERAGVSRGTFYFHFPSKEHVLFEMQRRHESQIVERLEEAASRRGDSLHEYLLGVVATITGQHTFAEDPQLAREIMAMYVRNPVLVDPSSMPLIAAVADGFADAADRGEIRNDVPPEELGVTFLAALFGFFIGSIEAEADDIANFELFIDIFVRGIQP